MKAKILIVLSFIFISEIFYANMYEGRHFDAAINLAVLKHNQKNLTPYNQRPFTTDSIKKKKSNIQSYTPSVILKKGQIDITAYNNLYTQKAYRGGNRELISINGRASYYTLLFQTLYGISKNGRLNIGIDANVKSVYLNSNAKSTGFELFGFNGDSFNQRTVLSTIGPKIKATPFKKLSHFSFQSAFWIPLVSNLEGDDGISPWLDHDKYTFWTQFFYDKNIKDRWQLFYEIDVLARIAKNANSYFNGIAKRSNVSFPASFFVNYFPTDKMTAYAMLQYSPTFQNFTNTSTGVTEFALTSDYAQTGVGLKFQLTSSLNLELSATKFFTALNGGAGKTFNLGLKFLK